jgi:hypothetical protein
LLWFLLSTFFVSALLLVLLFTLNCCHYSF